MTKYLIGDKVHVEFTVVHTSANYGLELERSDSRCPELAVTHTIRGVHGHYSAIVKHIPAPRPIEVGCRVRNTITGQIGTLLAVHADRGWVELQSTLYPVGATVSPLLSNLERIAP